MKVARTFLFYYSIFLSVFATASAVYFSLQSGNLFLSVLFIPVILYFMTTVLGMRKGRKFLLYYNFIFISILAVMGFVGISSSPQLISAIIFLPMALYFWLLVLPKKNKKLPMPDKIMPAVAIAPAKEEKITKGKIKKLEGEAISNGKFGKNFDLDRRMFLKLIGSTGLMVFMFSIFSKKAEGAFFGSVPGPGTVALKDTTGVQVDPAIKTPTDGYKITETDDSDPNYSYYGFVDKNGKWFIMREGNGAYRYTKGDSDFAHNWSDHKVSPTIPYNYFDVIFD